MEIEGCLVLRGVFRFRVSALNHEILYDAVKQRAVEESRFLMPDVYSSFSICMVYFPFGGTGRPANLRQCGLFLSRYHEFPGVNFSQDFNSVAISTAG